MKNKTIIKLLCTSLALIVIGGAISAAAAFSGGSLTINQSRHGIFSLIKWGNNSDRSLHNPLTFTAKTEISNFTADINFGAIEIVKGTSFSITTTDIDKNNITVSETNGQYHFEVRQDNFTIFGNNDGGKIYVTVPDTIREVEINQSLGEINIEKLDLTYLNVNSSMGDINLDTVSFLNGDISLDLGSFYFYGDFAETCKVSNNMGDVDIQLMKDEYDYNYDIKVSMGDVEINNVEHGSINAKYKQNNNKKSSLEADLDMGSINIGFGLKN